MTFKLNMSDQEAESKDFEYPPTGKYVVRITDIELGEVSKIGDNFGKPLWKVKLNIEEGPLQGTTIPTSVMLFSPALFSLKQLCEALHPEFIGEDGKTLNLPSVENGMPSPDPWLGQIVNIQGTKLPAGSKRKNGDIREYDEFQIKFKKPASAGAKAAASGIPMPS